MSTSYNQKRYFGSNDPFQRHTRRRIELGLRINVREEHKQRRSETRIGNLLATVSAAN
jgi:hypothetical protein